MTLARHALLVVLILAAGCGDVEKGSNGESAAPAKTEGRPASIFSASAMRLVSQDAFRTSYGGLWRLRFRVSLVGRAEDLEGITDIEMARVVEELRNPTGWDLVLALDGSDAGLRKQVSRELNRCVGREVISDVLFQDYEIYDVSD